MASPFSAAHTMSDIPHRVLQVTAHNQALITENKLQTCNAV